VDDERPPDQDVSQVVHNPQLLLPFLDLLFLGVLRRAPSPSERTVVKLRCERDRLVDTLATAARAVSGRALASAATNGLRLVVSDGRLRAIGTDLDLTIEAQAELAAAEDGQAVVPARLMVDIVRALEPGAVLVEAGEDDVVVSMGRSRFVVRSFPVEEFPTLPEPMPATAQLPAGALAEALRQVVRAASTDDSRPLLTGVLVAAVEEGLRLVATDSYRLAWRDLPGVVGLPSAVEQLLVPARALQELQRLLQGLARGSGGSSKPSGADEAHPGVEGGPAGGTESEEAVVGLSVGELEASFWLPGVRLTTRLLDGRFPDYRQLVPPEYPVRVQVPRTRLVEALRRVRLLVRDGTTPVRLVLHPDSVDLTVSSHDLGEASTEVEAVVTGTVDSMAFNPSYLIDGVEAVDAEEVVLELLDPSKPATVRAPDRADFRYLLMPVRVA
jgi:DNA polymerase-3 subunit beta